MTRINIGVGVDELCDVHLRAEARELPRVFRHCLKWDGRVRIELPTLGQGHELFFAPYGAWLCARSTALWAECLHRGFLGSADTLASRLKEFRSRWDGRGLVMGAHSQALGRGIIKARILERLAGMSREPIWTGRRMPVWCQHIALKAVS